LKHLHTQHACTLSPQFEEHLFADLMFSAGVDVVRVDQHIRVDERPIAHATRLE
jgi:hypothetical protein